MVVMHVGAICMFLVRNPWKFAKTSQTLHHYMWQQARYVVKHTDNARLERNAVSLITEDRLIFQDENTFIINDNIATDINTLR